MMLFLKKYKHLLGYLLLTIVVIIALAKISSVQTQLQQSIKSNLQSRVVTVTQRCQLTSLAQPKPGDEAALAKSLAGCYKQLAAVKEAVARTP